MTKAEQIPSIRTASQRDVVKKRNQASVSQHNNEEDVNLETQCTCFFFFFRYFCILTRVNILIFIKHLLKTLLSLECTDGAQAKEGGREVGENRTPSFKQSHRSHRHSTLKRHTDTRQFFRQRGWNSVLRHTNV